VYAIYIHIAFCFKKERVKGGLVAFQYIDHAVPDKAPIPTPSPFHRSVQNKAVYTQKLFNLHTSTLKMEAACTSETSVT
jgi:hypothetical protein